MLGVALLAAAPRRGRHAGGPSARARPPAGAAPCARAARGPPILALDPQPRRARASSPCSSSRTRANVRTYAAFRRKIECAIRTQVLPHLAHGRPNVVVFDEDVGLMTAAIGAARRAARALARDDPAGRRRLPRPGLPVRDAAAARARSATPTRASVAYYHRHLPGLGLAPRSCSSPRPTRSRGASWRTSPTSPAATASTSSPPTTRRRSARRATRAAVRALADPDRPRPRSVYVATSAARLQRDLPVGRRANVRRARAADAAQRRGPQPQGAADADRAGARADARARAPGGRARQPAALPAARHAGAPRLRDEPARLRLRRRRPPAADPCADVGADLHALPGPPRAPTSSSRPTPTRAPGPAPTGTASSGGSRCRG